MPRTTDIANLVELSDPFRHHPFPAEESVGGRATFLAAVDRLYCSTDLGLSTGNEPLEHDGLIATLGCLHPTHPLSPRTRAAIRTLQRLHTLFFGPPAECLDCRRLPDTDSALIAVLATPLDDATTPEYEASIEDTLARVRLLTQRERRQPF